MPLIKKKYTLQVFKFATGILIEEIHTKSIYERDAINRASRMVDAAKAKREMLEVVIKRRGYKPRVALVTPDEIIID